MCIRDSSYASSTTYVTGKAVEQACEKLKNNLCNLALQTFHCEKEDVEFTSQGVKNLKTNELLTLKELALKAMCGNNIETQVTVTHSSPFSPPPYMVGMVEIELDKETGQVDILDYVAVVDCGTVINTNLARVQTEGGLVQGIGMALYEDVQYTKRGAITENSFMQYKIPTRLDMGKIRVEFESSYEPTGPFGAKSIGEIVINTPSPATVSYTHLDVYKRQIKEGFVVTQGFKIADIDPREDEYENCFTISDKARCIAGGVIEAIFYLRGHRNDLS